MYVYPTHDYIRMEITVLYLKFHGINCRFNGCKYPFTQFATINSPIDAVKFSNTIQLLRYLLDFFSLVCQNLIKAN